MLWRQKETTVRARRRKSHPTTIAVRVQPPVPTRETSTIKGNTGSHHLWQHQRHRQSKGTPGMATDMEWGDANNQTPRRRPRKTSSSSSSSSLFFFFFKAEEEAEEVPGLHLVGQIRQLLHSLLLLKRRARGKVQQGHELVVKLPASPSPLRENLPLPPPPLCFCSLVLLCRERLREEEGDSGGSPRPRFAVLARDGVTNCGRPSP